MAVYIEYAILDNLVFDFCILFALSKTLRLKASFLRILLCACLATAFAVIIPLFDLNQWLLLAIKVLFGPLLCLLLCKRSEKKKIIWSILLFWAYTFVLGGAVLALIFAFCDFSFENAALFYTSKLPLGVYLLALMTFCYFAYNLVKYIKGLRITASLEKEAVIEICGKKIKTAAYIDSGNLTKEGGVPVCFALDKALCRKAGKIIACLIAQGQAPLKRVSFITVGEELRYLNAFLCEVQAEEKRLVCYVALSKTRDAPHALLLHADFLGGKNEFITNLKKTPYN